MQIAPGDPFSAYFDSPGMTPDMKARLMARYGFDQPVGVQYLRWLSALAQGEFGWSSSFQRPVLQVIGEALPNTMLLMALAFVSSIAIGVVVGSWQALRAGAGADRAVGLATFVIYSMPEFWLAMLLLMVFGVWLRWLPTSGTVSDTYEYMNAFEQLGNRLKHLVLPWLALTIAGAALFTRIQRAATRDTAQEAFVRNARARGLPEKRVRTHAIRASLTPTVTVAGLLFPAIVTGAVFVETVFSWQGMGTTMIRAIHDRDYALVSAIVVIGSAFTVLGSLLADVFRGVVDPRAREHA